MGSGTWLFTILQKSGFNAQREYWGGNNGNDGRSSSQKANFCAAFPKNGRITREGIQYCNGTPIHRTMFAQDPFNPVKHSRVADVLKEQTTVYCSAIEEMDNLPGILQTDRQEIIICDGIDDRQLEQIGEALTKRETFVSAGSAGLAGAIAKCICKAADQSKVEQNAEAPIFLIGSVSQIALDQIDWAEQAGFRIVQLTERQKFSSDFWKSEEKEPLLSLLKDATAREMPVIVVSIRSQKELMHGNPYVQWEDLQEDDIPKRVARSFGNLAKEMADRGITHTFVVFGGDTLVEVTRALGGVGIKPLDEIGTGCVYAKVSAGQKDYFVCSKAGGFGGEDVIVQIWNWFSEMKRKSQMEN